LIICRGSFHSRETKKTFVANTNKPERGKSPNLKPAVKKTYFELKRGVISAKNKGKEAGKAG